MTNTTTAFLERIPEGELVETEFTLEEFLDHNPEEPPYLEYEGKGRVRRKMSPNTEHAAIAAWLSHLMYAYRERTGRLVYPYVELRTNVDDQSKVPDVAVYVGKRPAENERKQAIVVADLSIEIMSPGQQRRNLMTKCWWYIQRGGRFAMLVEPDKCEVLLFGGERTITASSGNETESTFAPFEVWMQTNLAPVHYGGDDAERVIAELDELLPELGLSASDVFSPLQD